MDAMLSNNYYDCFPMLVFTWNLYSIVTLSGTLFPTPVFAATTFTKTT